MPRRLALACALACLSSAAWADFRADYESTQGDAPTMSRIEVAGDHMRLDAGRMSMLFDVGAGKLIMLMHDKHEYMDMNKMAETAGAAMAQANAALANLPPEQRAMIEQRMHGAMGGAASKVSVRITPTGASDRVGGWSCQVYRTEVGERRADESCMADSADAGITAADRATVHRAFDQIKAMTEKMSAGMFKAPIAQVPEGKFPVRITHYEDNGNVQTVVLKGISSGGISASDFAIPAGYVEKEVEMHGPPGRRH